MSSKSVGRPEGHCEVHFLLMGVLRCTAKYRKLVGLPEDLGEPPAATGALGEWYANPLNIGRDRYLHYMSENARLSVLIGLRERKTAEQRFVSTVYELLRSLGVKETQVGAWALGR